jgi:hypothetical protein
LCNVRLRNDFTEIYLEMKMKNQKPAIDSQKIVLVVALTTLNVFFIEIVLVLLDSNREGNLVVWVFHRIWEIMALIGIYTLVKKLKASFGKFVIMAVLGSIISTVVWAFIPDSLKFIRANYYGIETRYSNETHQEGQYDQNTVPDFPLITGYLYKADDPDLAIAISESTSYNEYVATKGFFFWQTGFANGFKADLLKQYNGADSFFDQIELFFTVGLVVLVECLINGLYKHFFTFILAQIIWFLVRSEDVWWHMSV